MPKLTKDEAELLILGGRELLRYIVKWRAAAKAKGIELEALLAKSRTENDKSIFDLLGIEIEDDAPALRGNALGQEVVTDVYYRHLLNAPGFDALSVGDKVYRVETENTEEPDEKFVTYWVVRANDQNLSVPPGAVLVGTVSR